MRPVFRHLLFTLSLLLFPCLSSAQNITVKRIPATFNGATLVAVDADGTTTSATISSRTAKVAVAAKTARLYIRNNGSIERVIGAPLCRKKSSRCRRNTVVLAAKTKKRIRLGRDKEDGVLFAVGRKRVLLRSFNKKVKQTKSAVIDAVNSAGLSGTALDSLASGQLKNFIIEDIDADNDGLVDNVDSDDDGDSILDNYDEDAQSPGNNSGGFSIFSNFKLNISQTVNLHATGLDTSRVDQRLQDTQTLAIQVTGPNGATTELDCGDLSYCSAGGTGVKLEDSSAFPGDPEGPNDVDGDGLGEIEAGGTGDFQLQTGATSSEIAAGDTFIQVVTNSGEETFSSGMLNYVFYGSPAIQSLAINDSAAETVDYEATNILGSNENCFTAPASGDISITATGWRPQRPGQADAGEGEFVDLGNSQISLDIPNAPCVTTDNGGCTGNGPGQCDSTAYSTTDENLAVNDNGLKDSRGDVDADKDNTYSFTVNLSDCIGNAKNGPKAWNADETVFVDLQFSSEFGDNAAQKFCIKREAS